MESRIYGLTQLTYRSRFSPSQLIPMECVQWAVLSKLPGSYSFHIFQISKPRVVYFVNRFIWHVGGCRVCVYVCLCWIYVCVYAVWCKTRLKINLRLDTIKSPVQFSSFSAQLVFSWLTALSSDFVLKECGWYHSFVTI